LKNDKCEEKPILSICVPTYNRLKYLKELVPNILRQRDAIENGSKMIEILIINNASNDGTKEYLAEVKDFGVTIIENTNNIGGDLNILLCAKVSNGAYVWIFGDDDILADGGMLRVLDIISEGKAILIVTLGILSKTIHYNSYKAALRHLLPKYPQFMLWHSLISGNVFSRKIYNPDKHKIKILTNYGHMYGIVDGLRNMDGDIVILKKNDACVLVRSERAPFAIAPVDLEIKWVKYHLDIFRKFDLTYYRYVFYVYYFIFLPVKRMVQHRIWKNRSRYVVNTNNNPLRFVP